MNAHYFSTIRLQRRSGWRPGDLRGDGPVGRGEEGAASRAFRARAWGAISGLPSLCGLSPASCISRPLLGSASSRGRTAGGRVKEESRGRERKEATPKVASLEDAWRTRAQP
jgi:hypothetical protein